jgi:hypothetical protein
MNAANRCPLITYAARYSQDPVCVRRVCIDDDAAARQALVLGYAMSRPGIPARGGGYRGLLTQMGFGAELMELEQRHDRARSCPSW